jgi:hypothetical protein
VKKYTAEARSSQRSENFLIKNSLLRVLRASAVQFPSPASQESLKTHMLQRPADYEIDSPD